MTIANDGRVAGRVGVVMEDGYGHVQVCDGLTSTRTDGHLAKAVTMVGATAAEQATAATCAGRQGCHSEYLAEQWWGLVAWRQR
jgi:hypothetical protein